MRKRKTTYPPAKTANRPPPASGLPGDPAYVRTTVATINLDAAKGKSGLSEGRWVRITGTGLYSGEIAVIEKLITGVISQAAVRTESGNTRRVRTIDLEPVDGPTPKAPSGPTESPAAG